MTLSAYREVAMAASLVRQGNLPAELTTFVGRRAELATAKRLLEESRLVTLTGPGGVGKTRLALRLASQLERAFDDGVWVVDLATIADSSLVAARVASVFGLRDESARWSVSVLAEYLTGRRLLLLLDNCEHLLDPCAVLAETLLRGLPELQIVATSTQALGVAGEQVLTVPPLDVPDAGRAMSAELLLQHDAVALFIERARAGAPSFTLRADNADAVSRLVRRLDGIPLAIELAAARARVLSPAQILARLDEGNRLLTSGSRTVLPHQRSLRALIDWSFDLCTQEERALWARLSVFPFDLDLDAAEEICAGDGIARVSVLDAVAGLIDKSVLIAEENGVKVRYRMPQTLREYGQSCLAGWGQQETFQRNHHDYYRRLAVQAWHEWFGRQQVHWTDWMQREHLNLLAAYEYGQAARGAVGGGWEILRALSIYWSLAGPLEEWRRVLERALAAQAEPSRLRALLTCLATWAAVHQGDLPAAESFGNESRELAQQFHDPASYSFASLFLGRALMSRGDLDAAAALFEQSLQVRERPPVTAAALRGMAEVAAHGGDMGLAKRRMGECLAVCDAHGESWDRATSLSTWAVLTWRHGDSEQAMESARESLRLWSKFQNRLGIAQCVELLAWTAADAGDCERSAVLLGAAAEIRRGVGAGLLPDLAEFRRSCEAKARGALGERTLSTAMRRGANMPLTEVIGYALGEHPKTVGNAPGEEAVLTRREREIADLVAQGLSNREIASRLVIAQRTAEGHVEHVLGKLGFTSRAQIAAWVAGRPSSGQ
jgi:predicted ATPase/DNA-binding CsgD family transcriptional regulator